MIAVTPIKKRRLSTQVAESLRSYIVERALQPGDRLPPERDLAAALAVSRTVLREALRTLEEQGLITVNHGGATVVRDWLPVPEPSQAVEREQTVESATSALEARAVFEAGLAELIVERATDADIWQLEKVITNMEGRLSAARPGAREDIAFHEQLLRCTHNPELLRIGRTIVLGYLRTHLLKGSVSSRLESPETLDIDEHATILAAIRRRDIEGLHRVLRFHGYPMDSRERAQAGLLPYWARSGERDAGQRQRASAPGEERGEHPA